MGISLSFLNQLTPYSIILKREQDNPSSPRQARRSISTPLVGEPFEIWPHVATSRVAQSHLTRPPESCAFWRAHPCFPHPFSGKEDHQPPIVNGNFRRPSIFPP